MWLSRRITQPEPPEDAATLGTVTIGGVDTAVVNDAEKRNAKVISPGGYAWQPAREDCVLVVRGNDLYLTGMLQSKKDLEPGEVVLFSNGAEIHICNDGKVEVKGELLVNGRKVLTE